MPALRLAAVRDPAARLAAAARALPPRTILWLGFGLFLLYAFPGYMSNDSVVQLGEARDRAFSNPHPPIMAAEWAILDAIIAGPVLMLVVQAGLFLTGIAALLRRIMAPRAAAVVACLVLLFPPVMTTMAVIWKDSQMAAYLVAGTALMLSDRRWIRLVGVLAITAGCAFRYNAFGGSVPLVVVLFEWRPGLRWFRRHAIALVVAVATVVAAFAANHALTSRAVTLTPAYADILGVLTFTRDRSDAELLELLRDTPLHGTHQIQARARATFSPRNGWLAMFGDQRVFDPATTDVQRAALTRAWSALVTGDPRAYLAYRAAVFGELIGLTDDPPWSAVFNDFLETAQEQMFWIDHAATWSRLQFWIGRAIGEIIDTLLFRPYLYLAIGLLLLATSCRDRLSFALLMSGLGYELSFFPLASSPDFRYSHWMIVCVCLTVVILFTQRWHRGRPGPVGAR